MNETAVIRPDVWDTKSFGCSVYLKDTVIIIGAEASSNTLGRAYLFSNSASGWTSVKQKAILTVSKGAAMYGYFGHSVCLTDSLAIVGAIVAGTGTTYEHGLVYVYKKPLNGWQTMNQTAVLSSSNGGTNDNFGSSISATDNLIIVGAPQKDIAAYSDAGTAYIFQKPSSGWMDMNESAILTSSKDTAWANFGCSVAIKGDTVIVASKKTANQNGYLYFYKKPEHGWSTTTESSIITILDHKENSSGFTFSYAGNNLVAGMPQTNDETDLSGNVYFYEQKIDYAPTDITLSNEEIIDNSPTNSIVGTLTTVDNKTTGSHVYALKDSATNDNSKFIIENNVLKSNAPIDILAQSSYTIYIQSTNERNVSYVKKFVITIKNITPTDILLSNNEVLEDSPVETYVGTFSTIDQTLNDTHIYSLIQGNGINDADNYLFTVLNNYLKTNSLFTSIKKDTLSIYIKTTDGWGDSFCKSFSVDIRRSATATPFMQVPNGLCWPNPSSGMININTLSFKSMETKIFIINELGQIMLEQKIRNKSNISQLDLSSLKKGIYFIKIIDSINPKCEKIIIE